MNYLKKLISKSLYFLPRIILFAVFFLYSIFAFLTYFDYFEPYLYPLHFIKGNASYISENIIIGPYPNYDELKKLKEKYAVEIVLSLLNTNLPQERALLEKERKDTEKLGLKILSFPMEYISLQSEDNKKNLLSLIQCINENKGKTIYIHCYLGRHRVNFVKKGLTDARFNISVESMNLQKSLNDRAEPPL